MKFTVLNCLEEWNLVDQVIEGIQSLPFAQSKMNEALDLLDEFKVFCTDAKTRLGRCCYGARVIELNEIYFTKHGLEKDRNDTFLHEIAHALHRFFVSVHDESHGLYWRMIAKGIGCRATRTASGDDSKVMREIRVANAKHVYTCKKCGYKIYKYRKLKNLRHRYHGPCGERSGRLIHNQLR